MSTYNYRIYLRRQKYMSTKKQIVDYVTHTPENVNSNVLSSMLDSISGGASSWADLTGKPFDSVGNGLKVESGALTADTPSSRGAGEGSMQIGTGVAESDYSVAEGLNTKTLVSEEETQGRGSHAEGIGSIAKASGSHAEGNTTMTLGSYSHAEGSGTTTGGVASHAEGNGTVTNNFAEHAEGSHNVSNKASDSFGDEGNTISSIGIGTSLEDKKNAWEVMQNGDAYLYGVGDYDGTNTSEAKTLQEVLSSSSSGADWDAEEGQDRFIANKPGTVTIEPDPQFPKTYWEDKKINVDSNRLPYLLRDEMSWRTLAILANIENFQNSIIENIAGTDLINLKKIAELYDELPTQQVIDEEFEGSWDKWAEYYCPQQGLTYFGEELDIGNLPDLSKYTTVDFDAKINKILQSNPPKSIQFNKINEEAGINLKGKADVWGNPAIFGGIFQMSPQLTDTLTMTIPYLIDSWLSEDNYFIGFAEIEDPNGLKIYIITILIENDNTLYETKEEILETKEFSNNFYNEDGEQVIHIEDYDQFQINLQKTNNNTAMFEFEAPEDIIIPYQIYTDYSYSKDDNIDFKIYLDGKQIFSIKDIDVLGHNFILELNLLKGKHNIIFNCTSNITDEYAYLRGNISDFTLINDETVLEATDVITTYVVNLDYIINSASNKVVKQLEIEAVETPNWWFGNGISLIDGPITVLENTVFRGTITSGGVAQASTPEFGITSLINFKSIELFNFINYDFEKEPTFNPGKMEALSKADYIKGHLTLNKSLVSIRKNPDWIEGMDIKQRYLINLSQDVKEEIMEAKSTLSIELMPGFPTTAITNLDNIYSETMFDNQFVYTEYGGSGVIMSNSVWFTISATDENDKHSFPQIYAYIANGFFDMVDSLIDEDGGELTAVLTVAKELVIEEAYIAEKLSPQYLDIDNTSLTINEDGKLQSSGGPVIWKIDEITGELNYKPSEIYQFHQEGRDIKLLHPDQPFYLNCDLAMEQGPGDYLILFTLDQYGSPEMTGTCEYIDYLHVTFMGPDDDYDYIENFVELLPAPQQTDDGVYLLMQITYEDGTFCREWVMADVSAILEEHQPEDTFSLKFSDNEGFKWVKDE